MLCRSLTCEGFLFSESSPRRAVGAMPGKAEGGRPQYRHGGSQRPRSSGRQCADSPVSAHRRLAPAERRVKGQPGGTRVGLVDRTPTNPTTHPQGTTVLTYRFRWSRPRKSRVRIAVLYLYVHFWAPHEFVLGARDFHFYGEAGKRPNHAIRAIRFWNTNEGAWRQVV